MKILTKNSRYSVGALFLGVCLLMSQALLASQETVKPHLSGYDIVSYFTKQKAEQGVSKHSTEYKNKTYWFSSEQHKALFLKQPSRYLPQYDGYCAFGVQFGQKIKSSPEAWAIVDNKLYLATDKSWLKKWKKDTSTAIREGDVQWSLLDSD